MTSIEAVSMSSMVRVLQTTELLEAVLNQLSFADLFIAQRVSKTWLQLIEGSLPLQRKLFFQPDFCAPRSTMTVRDSGYGLVCGLDFGSIFETYEIQVPKAHLLLQNTTIIQLHQDPPRKHVLQNAHYGSYRDSLLEKKGSWEKQLIAQPPPKKIKVQCTVSNTTGDIADIEDRGGVRLGPVARVLRELHETVRERGRMYEGNVSIVIDIVER